MEYQDLINPVEEFRPEDQLDLIHNVAFHPLVIPCGIFLGIESQFFRINNCLGACIGCHDDHRIAKVHFPSLGIGDMAIIQHLQQDVEYIRMRLFNLVKQDDRIRMPSHLLA